MFINLSGIVTSLVLSKEPMIWHTRAPFLFNALGCSTDVLFITGSVSTRILLLSFSLLLISVRDVKCSAPLNNQATYSDAKYELRSPT